MYTTINQTSTSTADALVAVLMLFVTVVFPTILVFHTLYLQKRCIYGCGHSGQFISEDKNDQVEQTVPVDLGERMKYYEAMSENISVVEPEQSFVIRIDGRAFSKYTKSLKALSQKTHDVPYSPEFKRCMLLTANSLLREFRPSTVYTHSDEITLIFSPSVDKNGYSTPHAYDGKVRKLLSLIPSYASVVFKTNIDREMELVYGKSTEYKNVSKQLQSEYTCGEVPTFDARLIVFPEDYEIVNCIMWRSKGDCTRNFVAMFSDKYLSKKSTHQVSTKDRIIMLREKGFELEGEDVDISMKYGTMLKINGEKRGNTDDACSVFYSFKNFKFSNEMLDFLLAKNSLVGVDKLSICQPVVHDYHKLFFDVPNHKVKNVIPIIDSETSPMDSKLEQSEDVGVSETKSEHDE